MDSNFPIEDNPATEKRSRYGIGYGAYRESALLMGTAETSKGYTQPFHTHSGTVEYLCFADPFQVVYIVDGQEEIIHFEAGEIAEIPAGVLHTSRTYPNSKPISMNFCVKAPDALRDRSQNCKSSKAEARLKNIATT